MKYFTDGWMMGSNPSPYGGGFTVVDEKDNLTIRETIYKKGFTNNEAEIKGILYALEYADKGDTISTDSMTCLTWVNTGKSKSRPDLNELLLKCKSLKEEKKINVCWEGRDFNLAGIYNETVGIIESQRRMEEEIDNIDNLSWI